MNNWRDDEGRRTNIYAPKPNGGQIDYQTKANKASQDGEFEWEREIWSNQKALLHK